MTHLLGIPICESNKEEILDKINILTKENNVSHIVTLNTEIMMASLKNNFFNHYLLTSKLNIPESFGITKAYSLLNKKKLMPYPGVELTQHLIAVNKYTLFFLGSTQSVLDNLIKNLKNEQNNIKIVGSHHGFFKKTDIPKLIKLLNEKKPDIIFVGMGVPKQEEIIIKLKKYLIRGVLIGVGGSFDIISKTKKRAPLFYQTLGLEWVYRTIKEPYRIKKWPLLFAFLFKILILKIRKN